MVEGLTACKMVSACAVPTGSNMDEVLFETAIAISPIGITTREENYCERQAGLISHEAYKTTHLDVCGILLHSYYIKLLYS